jgi:pimeloyl-ACP methyl ester carboxylesterase
LIMVKHVDYTTWSDEHLKQLMIQNGAYATSVWFTEPNDKPLIVLVHGISGDFGGLVPLAIEMEKAYRLAIVELPGHGGSDAVPLPDAAALQQWFDSTLHSIEQKMGPATAICAHSFGCASVLSSETIAHKKIILLNPVPTPSSMYVTYSRIIMNSAHFWAHIYNWRIFVLLRGMTLTKLRTREAVRRVRWVGWHARPSYDQIVFQAGLVDVVLDSSAYVHADNSRIALVVCGMFDTTAHQRDSLDMFDIFGNTNVVFLRGGHLLPIESPERVANLIMDVMVK